MAEPKPDFEYPPARLWFVHFLIYNTRPEEFYGDEYDPQTVDHERFVNSVDDPPTIEDNGDWWDDVAEALTEVIRDHIEREGLPQVDVYNEPIWPAWPMEEGSLWEDFFYTGADLGRVLVVRSVRDPNVVSRQLVADIQQRVLAKYRLWCIYLADEDDDNPLTIFPQAIRSISMTNDKLVEDHFDEWLADYRARYETTNGPERRQLLWLRRTLPEATQRLDEDSVIVVGHFDNSDGNFSRHIIWTLQRQSDRDRYLSIPDQGESESPIGLRGSRILTDVDGTIISRWKSGKPCFAYLIPWVYESHLEIARYAILNRDGEEIHSGSLSEVAFVTDEELRGEQGASHIVPD